MQAAHMAPMSSDAERGPEMKPPSTSLISDMRIWGDSVIPASGIDGGYGYSSYTMEPSVGSNGRYAFQTGNWYASKYDSTANKGAGGWTYLNPFTIFGSGFCCDQVTFYQPQWDRQYWILLYGDHVAFANARGETLSGWCYYNIDASWFGLSTSSYSLDYNDAIFTKNYVYLAVNIFGPSGGFGSILRMPINQMNACGGFGYNYYYDTSHFTFKPVQGAVNTMYWASNWGGSNGGNIRIYSWPENGSISYADVTIDSFNFEYRNNGQFCGSADGVVTNWCAYNDSRVKAGYLANGVLGFGFDVTQGSGYPFPFWRQVSFNASNMTYIGHNDTWASWGAFQYGTTAPNDDGDIGGSWSWGGGASGGSDYYPGTGYFISDDYGYSYIYQIYGAGNTCTYSGIPRWGDYLTVRPAYPAPYSFVGTGWAIKGGNCYDTGYSEPHMVFFGRNRDVASFSRWKQR